MKLITPVGLLITTALLAIYSVAAARMAMIERSYVLAAAAVVSIVACVGTAFMRRWSQYLVHLLTAGYTFKWCLSIYGSWWAGYFQFQFGSNTEALRSLLPEFAILVLSVTCSWIVHDHFSNRATESRSST